MKDYHHHQHENLARAWLMTSTITPSPCWLLLKTIALLIDFSWWWCQKHDVATKASQRVAILLIFVCFLDRTNRIDCIYVCDIQCDFSKISKMWKIHNIYKSSTMIIQLGVWKTIFFQVGNTLSSVFQYDY